MKHKLLFLGIFLMASVSMSAQTFTVNRTKLVPNGTSWAAEEVCYLWNIGAQGFYTNHQGPRVDPYWGTRAVVSDTIGQQVIFSRTNPGDVQEDWDADGVLDNTYLFTSYVSCSGFQKFYCTFADGWNGIWTDNNTNQYRFFNVIDNGTSIKIERNMFLANGGEAEEGKYLGILASDGDKTVKLHDTEEYLNDDEEPYYNIDPAAEFWEDWMVVSEEEYDAWVSNGGKDQAKLFVAAASLKKALQDAYAKNPGINNLDDLLAVYNNEAATVEELEEAEAAIQGRIVDWKANQDVSVDDPIDFSDAIINNTFDVIGDFTGWSFGEGTKQFGAGGDTSTCAEVWRGSFDGYQTLSNLPDGVYRLSVNAYCRYNDNHVDDYNNWKAGNRANAKLYMQSETDGEFSTPFKCISEGGSIDEGIGGAGNSVDSTDENNNPITIFTPNSMVEANAYFHDEANPKRYYNEVFGALEKGESLRIGAKNAATADWNVMDDFQLFYYGNKPEAFKYWGSTVAANSNISFAGVYYGKPDKDAYEQAKAALANSETKDDIIANIPLFEAAIENVSKSKVNYADFVKKYNETIAWLEENPDLGGDYIDLLSDYLSSSADDFDPADERVVALPNGYVNCFLDLENNAFEGTLDADEIAAETEFMLNLKILAIQNSMEDGSDLTSFIINPGFEEAGGKGWSLDTHGGTCTNGLTNWHGGNANNYCAEAYEQKFDVYQVIKEEVPNGLYEVSVQAYYRDGWPADAYDHYLEGATTVPTYVYFNDFSAPVRNVMEILYDENLANNCSELTDPEGNTVYALNGMASASTAFDIRDDNRNFTQKVYGLVTDGKIRLGIRNLTQSGTATWSLWDNFKLTYRAKNPEALASVIDYYITRAEELINVSGETMGTPAKNDLISSMSTANDAKESGDGNTMYDALKDLVADYNTADESTDLYKQLTTAMEDFVAAIEEYEDTASGESQEAAITLYEEVNTKMEGDADQGIEPRSYSNDEIPGVIDQINEAIVNLKMPADIDQASDDYPIDMTFMIVNPSYENNDSEGWSGGEDHSGYNRQDMVEYYYASFDHHQTIKNLRAGTYELKVNCFARVPGNNAQTDLNTLEAGEKLQKMTAFVYAIVGDQTFAEPFRMISEGARQTPDAISVSYNEITNSHGELLYTPNNMQAAGAAFEEMAIDDETGEEVPLSDELNYVVRVTFTLAEQGDVTIGCKNEDTQEWCIWDNWELTYFGTESQRNPSGDATLVEEIENNNVIVATGIYTLGGVRVAKMQKGINIVKMSDGSFRKVYIK